MENAGQSVFGCLSPVRLNKALFRHCVVALRLVKIFQVLVRFAPLVVDHGVIVVPLQQALELSLPFGAVK